jgi:hypothetical protein
LGTVIIAQLVIASACRYKQTFFFVVIMAFLWAGSRLPLSEAWLQGRWIVLAIGALVGAAIYLRERIHHVGAIHMIALCCVLSAVVSASVSVYSKEALLKSLSLFLLFLYAATGARLAVPKFAPEKFFNKLLLVCEITTVTTAITYFGFQYAVFGNPNSLGAVMGVVIVPVVFWGFLCAQSNSERRRLALELCLAVALLMSSLSRAGIAAAVVSCCLVCIAMRKYRLIVAGLITTSAIATLAVSYVPRPAELLDDAQSQSITSLFLYKGKPKQGLWGSRRRPWDETLDVIKSHPWFGSGFGTSITGQSATYFELTRSRFIDSRMIREHGNSFLAIAEWSGLLGVFPFYSLTIIVAFHARKVFVNLRRTGNILSPAVPAAAIVTAGLIGAAFEDWLFAVGYYLCVFFWAMAFILADLLQEPQTVYSDDPHLLVANPQFASSAAQ